MSVALPAGAAGRGRQVAVSRTAAVDALLYASVFTITFAKVRWAAGAADINISDITASLFVLAFAAARAARRDSRVPRTVAVLLGFLALFTVVYLVGFFNLATATDRDLFAKGLVKFLIHFAFLCCAVAHLARRGPAFYWRTLGWLVAGIVANCVYGLGQLAVAETSGRNLDEIVLSAIGSYPRGGINVYGAVGGANVYRTNALTLDPNHLGIMLIVPLLVLLPIYLRLERGHRLRLPLAFTLAFLAVVELTTLSRSGLLGLAVGLVVLAVPYRRLLLSARVLVPLAAVALVVGAVVAQRTGFFEQVLRSRVSLGGGSTRVHLELYELLPPVLQAHPLFGLGLNTFSSFYEFVTGKSNWGPHSYYVAVLAETGLAGAAAFLAYLAYLFRRLGLLRRLGRALAAAGDATATRVLPLGWGLTAALTGTLVANVFYLTMQMYYFFALALLIAAAPVVFSARSRDRRLDVPG
ncbi:MAG: O-antigen ligase family protein [Thermoleophilia bacterium]|nr:O-antigen ligase family protein [Thermoleophilia bacterium]